MIVKVNHWWMECCTEHSSPFEHVYVALSGLQSSIMWWNLWRSNKTVFYCPSTHFFVSSRKVHMINYSRKGTHYWLLLQRWTWLITPGKVHMFDYIYFWKLYMFLLLLERYTWLITPGRVHMFDYFWKGTHIWLPVERNTSLITFERLYILDKFWKGTYGWLPVERYTSFITFVSTQTSDAQMRPTSVKG